MESPSNRELLDKKFQEYKSRFEEAKSAASPEERYNMMKSLFKKYTGDEDLLTLASFYGHRFSFPDDKDIEQLKQLLGLSVSVQREMEDYEMQTRGMHDEEGRSLSSRIAENFERLGRNGLFVAYRNAMSNKLRRELTETDLHKRTTI